MAWKDLHEDLAELFAEFSTRADDMLLALSEQIAKRRARHCEYSKEYYKALKLDQARMAAYRLRHNAYKKERYWANLDKAREDNRAKQARYRARHRAPARPKGLARLEPCVLEILADESLTVKGAMVRTGLAQRTVQRYRAELRATTQRRAARRRCKTSSRPRSGSI